MELGKVHLNYDIVQNIYVGHGVQCGTLNVFDPHKLIENGIIRRCGFIGVDMSLLEKIYLYSL